MLVKRLSAVFLTFCQQGRREGKKERRREGARKEERERKEEGRIKYNGI